MTQGPPEPAGPESAEADRFCLDDEADEEPVSGEKNNWHAADLTGKTALPFSSILQPAPNLTVLLAQHGGRLWQVHGQHAALASQLELGVCTASGAQNGM